MRTEQDDQLVIRILEDPRTVYQQPQRVAVGGDTGQELVPVIRIDTAEDPRAERAVRAISGSPIPPPRSVAYVTGMLNPLRPQLPAPGGALIVVWPTFGETADYDFDGPAIHLLLARHDLALDAMKNAAQLAARRRRPTVTVVLEDARTRPEATPDDRIPLGWIPVTVHAKRLLAVAKFATSSAPRFEPPP